MKIICFLFLILSTSAYSQSETDFIQGRGKKMYSMIEIKQRNKYIQVTIPKLSLIQSNFNIYITANTEAEGYVVNANGDKYKFKTIPETLNKLYAMGYRLMPNVSMQNDLIENTTASIEIKYMFERVDSN